MITSDPTSLIVSLIAGLLAGGIFFAGLWYTVRKLAVSDHPGLVVALSFIVRVAIVLGAFYLVGRGHFDRMLFCLGGFLIARIVIIRLTRERRGERKEAAGAP